MSEPQLPALAGQAPIARVPGDYHHLQTVVEVAYPVSAARTYLNRHLGNPVRFHLVEVKRGERVGHVRSVQVNPAAGGDPVFIRGVRTMPDGSRASHFVPDDIVTVTAELVTADGRLPNGLEPKDEIVLHVPVRGYLRFLPGVYQGGAPVQQRRVVKADQASVRRWGAQDAADARDVTARDADAMRRFLSIFQHIMTSVIDHIEAIPSLTDPLTADPRFLPWIASWVTFTLDASLPLHQQRELVRRAIRLYRTRGTTEGVEEIIKVLTAAPVEVSPREKPLPFVLGGATLSGGATVSERYEKGEPRAHYLYDSSREAINFFSLVLEPRNRFEDRFSERAPDVLKRLTQIVTAEKPAHITFTIRFEGD